METGAASKSSFVCYYKELVRASSETGTEALAEELGRGVAKLRQQCEADAPCERKAAWDNK